MPKLTVNAIGTKAVALGDPFPTEGLLTVSLQPGDSVDKSVTAAQLKRMEPQLQALELKGDLSYAVVLDDGGDARAEGAGLPGAPQLTRSDADDISAAAGSADLALFGTGLLAGQAKASLSHGDGTSALTLEAQVPGRGGNDISLQITDTGSLTVGAVGNQISVTIDGGTTTANDVKSAMDGDADIAKLVAVTSGGAGTDIAVLAETNLSGGAGAGMSAVCDGVAAVVLTATDTEVHLEVPALAGAAAGDTANVVLSSGNHKSSLSLPVVA